MASLNDDLPFDEMSIGDLVRLASGRDLWRKAPALAELADRSPERALPLAREAVQGDDRLVAAAGLRVLAAHDRPAALEFIARTAPTAPAPVLEAAVEHLAVDDPPRGGEARNALEAVARRLRAPDTGDEIDLAQLFFRRHPELRKPS